MRSLTRDMIGKAFPYDVRLQRAFESQVQIVGDTEEGLKAQAEATEMMNEATVVTLSKNAAFKNERVLEFGPGLDFVDNGDVLRVDTSIGTPRVSGGYTVQFTVAGDTMLFLPLSGRLATIQNTETLENKTLDSPSVTNIDEYADDAAAAAGGVEVGGVYRDGNNLKVRVA